jgi:hypothetical protein
MGGNASWVVFVAWGALGFVVARLFSRRFERMHKPWLDAVAERAAGGTLEGRSVVARTYWQLVGSVRSGFGYRFLQRDPVPSIERLRHESLTVYRRQYPYFIGFMVVWLGGFLLITTLLG